MLPSENGAVRAMAALDAVAGDDEAGLDAPLDTGVEAALLDIGVEAALLDSSVEAAIVEVASVELSVDSDQAEPLAVTTSILVSQEKTHSDKHYILKAHSCWSCSAVWRSAEVQFAWRHAPAASWKVSEVQIHVTSVLIQSQRDAMREMEKRTRCRNQQSWQQRRGS